MNWAAVLFFVGVGLSAVLFVCGWISDMKNVKLMKRERMLSQMSAYLMGLIKSGVSIREYSFHINPKDVKKYELGGDWFSSDMVESFKVTPDEMIKEGHIFILHDKEEEK